MPIQASGQISMQDIRDEIDNDEDDFSLADAADGQYETINISNLNANKQYLLYIEHTQHGMYLQNHLGLL